MNLLDLIKTLEEKGENVKRTPLCILKDHPALLEIHEDRKKRTDETKKKYREILEQEEKETKAYWDRVENYLIEKGLIKDHDVAISIKDGVLYLKEEV